MVVTCPNCGERMVFQMERCPRCQTLLNGPPAGQAPPQAPGRAPYQPSSPPPFQPSPQGSDFFGSRPRERARERSQIDDRSGQKQERGSLEQELKGETADTGRAVVRSELDQFEKGPDEQQAGPAPQPTPTSYRPTTYRNPYLEKGSLPDPRGQYAPSQPVPQQLLPQNPQPSPRTLSPVPATPSSSPGTLHAESAGRPQLQVPAERVGMASASTFERMGVAAPGLAMAECVLDGKLPELREADELGYSLLGIDMRHLKSTLCESPREWTEKLLGDVELSAAMKGSLLQNAQADRTVRGVFLPSRGLFVNGSAFGDALGRDRPQVVSTAIHEKLGHGFCNTYTLKGEEESKAGSVLFRLASAFGMKQIDEPLYPLWLQKKGVSLRSSFFLEEGFASWVQDRLVKEMARRHPNGGFEGIPTHATTLESLMGALAQAEGELAGVPIAYRMMDDYLAKWLTNEAERMREAGALDFDGTRLESMGLVARLARTALELLIADDGASPARAPQLMMALEAADRLLADAHRTGIQLRYEGGFLMMQRLASLFGERCVPAAVRIAGNVRYNLAAVSVDDLMKATSDPNYNCDARLASLCRLGPGTVPRDDARAFARAVNEALGYSLPEGM